MSFDLAVLLTQDGVTNGAVYALLALTYVLIFTVTRIIFIPQGEFVAFGALTLAGLQSGTMPGVSWLLLGLGAGIAAIDSVAAWRLRRPKAIVRTILNNIALPVVIVLMVRWLAPLKPPLGVQMLMTLALVLPLGPMIYRLAFRPIANASVLVLLIVSVAVHFALVTLGLAIFGAEGSRTEPISNLQFDVGAMAVSAQSLWVIGASVVVMILLFVLFGYTIPGKALRATAINRVGAKLVGIRTDTAGSLCFLLAAGIGAASGILISPITPIYYDSGLLIGLKGLSGAIVAGLTSYPLAVAAAVVLGLVESFSSFWASAYKEVIVFTLIIPVLLARSFSSHAHEEDE
jgi:branched-chain amino acid transport system permease protein